VRRTLVSILQVLGYLVAVVVVTIAVMGLTKMLVGDWESRGVRRELFGEGLLTTIGIAITSLLFSRLLKWKEVTRGWPGITSGLVWFAKGGLCGLFMVGLMLLLTIALGGARFSFEAGALGAYLRYAIPLLGCLLVAALAEEWFFRGYPLTGLADALGRGWANLLMSLLFAAAHLGSAGSNALVLTNIVLGSLVVGSLRFTPGGIPAAWGFHFVWNSTQVLVGANLSIEGIDVPGVTFSQLGSTIVSGGSFGPEAGIGATVSTAVVLVLLFAFFRRQGCHDLPLPLRRKRGDGAPSSA
jgi:membrane protease YdiL (CAAX protease family)